MTDPGDEAWGRLRKHCRHCGAWSATLGSVCPECGRSYEPLGLLDRIPFPGNDTLYPGYVGALYALAALAVVVVLVLLFVKSWVAGTIVLAALFVVLVAAIGVSNWLAQR
jgi:hypothetical protein